MRFNLWAVLVLVAALAGLGFAGVSTSDFAAHLDRQVHGVHCSFLPGLEAADVSGSSGCHVTLMSPYSSVMRDSVWGGIPISLPAMGVFGFLAFWSLWILFTGRDRDTGATGFLALATVLPVLSSLVMGYISLSELGAACKLCIGIYSSSVLAFVGATLLWLGARREQALASDGAGTGPGLLLGAFALGVAFVLIPVATYARRAPDFSTYVGACGELIDERDPQSVLVPVGSQAHADTMLEVLDPLCPACRGFEERFGAMPISETLSRKALLFPLDDTCNWMVDHAIHPGACSISEAVLCAANNAESVLSWSFANQDEIIARTRENPDAAATMAKAQFPALAKCIGSPAVRARLNRALRWAVDNRLQVLTPQVYVSGVRLCDEDTDLGLDYALPRLVEHARTRPKKPPPDRPGPGPSLAQARDGRPRAARPASAEAAEEAKPAEGEGDEPELEPPPPAEPSATAEPSEAEPSEAEPEAAAEPAKPAPEPPPAPEPSEAEPEKAEPPSPQPEKAPPPPAPEPAAPKPPAPEPEEASP